MPLRQHIRERLIAELQILLNSHMILDAQEDDRSGDEERTGEEHPVGDELVHEGHVVRVEGPHDGGAGGLDALVETDVVGHLAAVVGHGAHVPGGWC
jgi:hypothetical protein